MVETTARAINFTDETFDFNAMSRETLIETLSTHKIVLTPEEALDIQNRILKRPPSLAEAILWSIEGSEHCSYKSSRSHLKQLGTDGPNVIIGAKEDAGIISLCQDNQGNRYGLVISHESHNHPSQIVPYEGAATGVGGNVRDVNCMGAEVIAMADGLRFGDLNNSKSEWIHDGVVAGIGGYSNPLGIPTIAGDTYYHDGYNDNCLVTVVTLGVVAEEAIIHSYAPANAEDYDLILVGKPTDNSGFGGASFSSLELHEDKLEQNKGAVQEPNAFLERHLLKANYALFKKLRERNLIDRVGFKDLGAGGVACASVELAETAGYGAEIDLDQVHIMMGNLNPAVILCSETQERFMWVADPAITPMILEHYNKLFSLPQVSAGAQASVIGKIRSGGDYIVSYQGMRIVHAKAADVVKGIVYDRPTTVIKKSLQEPELAEPEDYNALLLQLLRHENIASRLPIYETYDKQVQGRTVIEAGHADAGVIAPFNNDDYPEEIRQVGAALSLDQNPRFCEIDAYWGTVNAIAESLRNVAAVGASPQTVTDCLCFGNPEKPEQMADFVQAIAALNDCCHHYHLKEHPEATLPIVAGNVSFYNESHERAIPASPMISCIGKLNNVEHAITQSFKGSGHPLFLLGARKDECGGSVYYQLHGELGANLPKPDIAELERDIHALHEAISQQLVLACHDISEGGLAVAITEMSFERKIGARVYLSSELRRDKLLFSESGGFILEIASEQIAAIKKCFADRDIVLLEIGETTDEPRLMIQDCINLPLDSAYDAWANGLREKLL
ncbi:MAG: phosphoribosylformylglycinamidine synthase subunit PurL [Gammaproteobacteria bacterium]|nr:phosphoribosylformylglycinamidine synthase subunit PurL [Gammaproteobacteria bacterium]